MKQVILQFIPIIALFLVLAYSRKMAQFSHSVLGKLIAVAIIVFYTNENKLLGLLACSLFVFYYQSDTVENMLNIDGLEGSDGLDGVETNNDDGNTENDILDDGIFLNKDKPRSAKAIEHMENYAELYPNEGLKKGLVQDEFRKENCKGNVLKYKDMTVSNDMAAHVFPELSFVDKYPCNPCAKSCNFSIIETKIKTEEQLVKPVFSIDTM
jgi:hypothetical protein